MKKFNNKSERHKEIDFGLFKKEWIHNGINKECIDFADKFGAFLKNNSFSTSQMRNVFGEVKRISLAGFKTSKTSFLLLKPKIAYAAYRADNKGAYEFRNVITQAHDAVKAGEDGDEIRFKSFCDFFEAILAYHKAHGGKS